MKKIESGDGDCIIAASNGTWVEIMVNEAAGLSIATIWLTTEQADELVLEIAKARVELSKARAP